MSRIDRIADFMRRQQGRRFVMRSNGSCLLFTEEGRKPLNQLMSDAEIETVVKEILPKDLTKKFAAPGAFIFPYRSPQGELSIGVRREDGNLEVTIGVPGEQVLDRLEEESEAHHGAAPQAVSEDAKPPPPVAAPQPGPASPSPAEAPAASQPQPRAVVPGPTLLAAVPAPAPVMVPASARALRIGPPTHEELPDQFFSDLFHTAVERDASDIHIRGGYAPRLRVSGELEEVSQADVLSDAQLYAALFDLIPPDRRGEWMETGSIVFCFSIREQARFRCHFLLEQSGVSAVFRLIPHNLPTPQELNLPEAILNLAGATRGLVIVSGSRASGRSMTFASLIAALGAKRKCHIVTLESPIEILFRDHHSLISQREIPTHVSSMIDGLRTASLADADVCGVSDLSDVDTLLEAFRVAESGMLVVGVLQYPEVTAVVHHLLSELSEHGRTLACQRLSQVLRAVTCQRLCPRSDGGRLPVFDLLTCGPAVASLIRDDNIGELTNMMFGGTGDMLSANEELLRCVQQKKVKPQDALLCSRDPDRLRTMFARVSIRL